MSARPLRLFFAFACICFPTAGALLSGKDSDRLLIVPSRLISTRAVRAIGSPAHHYQCALLVPPAANWKDAQPRMRTSTGVPALDSLAWDYARERISQSPELKKLLATKELEFNLVITPPSLERNDYREYSELPAPPSSGVGYWTPRPPYPFKARQMHAQGEGAIRVTFSPVTGLPLEVIMEKSTGSPLLDSSSIQWAALQWRWLSPGHGNAVKIVPISYLLR